MTPAPREGFDTDELPPWEQPTTVAHFENTDLGNARRLVTAFGHDIRYVPEWGKWLTWLGTHWRVDVTGAVQRMAKASAEQILDEARGNADEKLFRWGLRSQSAGELAAMASVASTEPGVPVLVDDLDRDPWLLALANGVLDLRTGGIEPPERGDLITKGSPVHWDPTAECPAWLAFLERIIPDPGVRAFLQRHAGYALTGDVREQVLLVLYGTGSNGKSTFKEVMLRLLGDLAQPAAPNLLFATRHEEHPTQVADLHGRRLVVSHEVEDGVRLDEALVKELTGGDRLKARFMRQDFWEFTPTHKLWLACNYKPRVRGTDHGIWRRIQLVDFPVTIPDGEQDKDLPTRLAAELPGILRWAVKGCLDWQRRGLDPPAAVLDATAHYRQDCDLVAQFVAERCVELDHVQVRSSDLYGAYRAWCTTAGLDHPLSQKALAGRLEDRGYDRSTNRAKQSIWLGLGLAESRDDLADATP